MPCTPDARRRVTATKDSNKLTAGSLVQTLLDRLGTLTLMGLVTQVRASFFLPAWLGLALGLCPLLLRSCFWPIKSRP